ncbi:MAG TPA: apolipoprotein N-acyltransferase, partial [Trueperaceae bacterium]
MISPADRAGPAPRAAWQARAFWLRVLVAAACGALFSAALPALSLWPLGSALVPLFVIVARVERRWDAFWPGFFFGLAFFVLYIFWLPRSFAELFGPAAWLIFPPLLGVLAAFWGIVTGASRALGGRGAGTLWLLPALWLLMEWARTQGSLAFPWGSLGYLWLGTPLAQVASLTGLYGLSLLTAVLAALLAAPFVVGWRRSLWPLAAAVLLAGSGLAYGLAWLRSPLPPRTETALLVQGNTDPLGRTLSLDQEMDLYASLTRQALAAGTPVDLVVWPEGVVPDNKIAGYQGAAGRQKILSAAGGATIITGGTAAERGRYYNSAFSLADGRITDRYDKV